ncbi:MAG: hypothetical protein J6B75_05615 [Ruminococcus sp.]|nr:hypothetical protein [Ruminococcus sp.]
MKKFLLVLCSTFLLAGCSDKTSESSLSDIASESATESQTEKPTESETEAQTEAETELPTEDNSVKPTHISNYKKEYPKVTELDLVAPNKNDQMNKEKTIYFSDDGYFYYTYVGGRDSANYALSFDNGNGEPVPLENCEGLHEDFICSFNNENVFYGVKRFSNPSRYEIHKYENGVGKSLSDGRYNYWFEYYFTEKYIYYETYVNKISKFYRMDYNGENKELIFTIDESRDLSDFLVYEDKLYYEWYENNSDKLGVYNMENHELIELNDGRIGRINGGYMYYCSYCNLMRMSLEDYSIELVCEDVSGFEFCGDTVFFSPAFGGKESGSLFRLENGEKQKIFDADEFFGTDYYYEIGNIQYENGRIFIQITSGPYYSYIAEIDSYGNVIRNFYEGHL